MKKVRTLCLLSLGLMLLGCPKSETSTDGGSAKEQEASSGASAEAAEGGGKTPEEAFDKLKAASNARDYRAFFVVLTRETQDRMLTGQLVGAAITLAPMGTKANPEKKKELDAIFAKHNVDAALTGAGATNPQTMMADMQKRLANVKDRPGLFDDMMKYLEKNSLNDQRVTVLSMEGLKVSGDKATAAALVKNRAGQTERQAIELHKTGGRWYVHPLEWK